MSYFCISVHNCRTALDADESRPIKIIRHFTNKQTNKQTKTKTLLSNDIHLRMLQILQHRAQILTIVDLTTTTTHHRQHLIFLDWIQNVVVQLHNRRGCSD